MMVHINVRIIIGVIVMAVGSTCTSAVPVRDHMTSCD